MKELFKKIIVIIKINILVLASYTSSAQATTTFVDAFSLIGQENDVTGFSFNDDGSKMFVVGGSGDDVNEYTLAQAYDVSTASFVDSFDISGFVENAEAITFNALGDTMYVVEEIGNRVYEFNLTTDFDVSETIVPPLNVLNLAPDGVQRPTGIAFNNDGSKMFIADRGTSDIFEYQLGANYDTSSAVLVGEDDRFDVGVQDSNPTGVTFNNDGTKMFVVGVDNNNVYEYSLTTGFDVSTASFTDSFGVNSQDTEPRSVEFNGDGSKMFVLGNTSSNINEYTLSVAYDIVPPDAINPTLLSSVPTDDASNVNANANIVLTFSEIVDAESGNITIKKTSDDSIVETIDVRGLKVTGSGSTTITINPATTLDSSTEYYVLIDTDAFDDTAENSYAGISSTTALSFTTADVNSPTLSSSVPTDDATDVSVNTNIILNFSENVDVESGNITIKKTSDDSTVETVDVASAKVTGTGTSQITINPATTLDILTEYYVLIDASAFDDSSGNSYAGISSTTALSFTTVNVVNPITDKDVIGSIDTQSIVAKNIISQSIGPISSRLSNLRRNRDSNNLSQNNIKLDFNNAILTSLTEELLAKNDKSIIPDNWSSWSEGTISVSKIGDRINSSSSKTDGQALAFGFDTKLNDNDLLGFAVQYGQSDTDIGSNGTNVDSENINLSIYRTRPLDDDNFIEGMFGVGLIESDLKRVSGANTLTGSRNGTQIFGSINYGKTLDKGDFNLTPIARVDLGYTELDAYSETGTDALTYAKQTIKSGLASVGLEFSDIVKFNDNKFKPFGSIEYGMDFSNSSDAKMNYVSDTSTIYTYTQGSNSNHLITSVVGFEYITKDNLEIISSYKRIQGNESEQTDILNVSVNFKSKRETEYAMSLDGSEDLKAGFDISKNINGFDLNFNANQYLSENSNRVAEVSMSRKF